jgi:hypothetical protein
VELQGRLSDLARDGLGLAAISYDSTDVLADFAARRQIAFPLLSDQGSATIKRYGLFNAEMKEGEFTYGIPYPGTFFLNARGEVTSRWFEDQYQERYTIASILARATTDARGGTTLTTPHLELTASASDEVVAPGNRFSLILNVTPASGMHVYAPGNQGYRRIVLRLEPSPLLTAHPVVYPASEEYFFAPVDERVQVFQKPFRLVQDVTVGASSQAQSALRALTSLTIAGTLEYQACDDKICFNPVSLPLTWTVRLKPLDREKR